MNGSIFEEIKERVSLCDEVEKTGTKVIHTSHNRKKCICPLHGDSNPSLIIYIEGNDESFYCFGCQKGGDVINFVTEYKKLEHSEWYIKDTINYFKKNYDIEFSEDQEQDIETILNKTIKRRRNSRFAYSYALIVSKKVRSFLNKTKNPKDEFLKISPYLKQIDQYVYDMNIQGIKTCRKFIESYIEEYRKNDR